MTRLQFNDALKRKLVKYFSEEEIKNALAFYEELLDDRIEHGEKEHEIIASFGSIDEVANRLKVEILLHKKPEKSVRKIGKNLTLLLLIASTPILLPIAFVFGIVIFALTVAFGSVAFSLVMATLGILIAIIPTMIHLIASGASGFVLVFAIGQTLFGLGIVLVLFTLLLQLFVFIFNKISYALTKQIHKKMKEGVTNERK